MERIIVYRDGLPRSALPISELNVRKRLSPSREIVSVARNILSERRLNSIDHEPTGSVADQPSTGFRLPDVL